MEVKSLYGVDVFAEPFDPERGYAIYRNDFADVLLIKLEKLNDVRRRCRSRLSRSRLPPRRDQCGRGQGVRADLPGLPQADRAAQLLSRPHVQLAGGPPLLLSRRDRRLPAQMVGPAPAYRRPPDVMPQSSLAAKPSPAPRCAPIYALRHRAHTAGCCSAGQTDYVRFSSCVGTRTGSTLLMRSLNNHSRIIGYGEIVKNFDRYPGHYHEFGNSAELFQRDPVRFLESGSIANIPPAVRGGRASRSSTITPRAIRRGVRRYGIIWWGSRLCASFI